jgi:hypothetical protein
MLQMGRQARSFGTQVLLQPFAYGITDRSTRLAIDLFAVLGDSAVHDCSVSGPFQREIITFDQVTSTEIVSC